MNRDEALLRELGLWPTVSLLETKVLIEGQDAFARPQEVKVTPPSTKPVSHGQSIKPLDAKEERVKETKPEEPVKSTGQLTLQERVLSCAACALHATRQHALVGKGNAQADWLVIAESPSTEEDLLNQVAIGSAGEMLANLLNAVGATVFENTYHTYLVKCRPVHNRPPSLEESRACRHHLLEEISHLQPKVIVLLGRTVAKLFLELDLPLTQMRQKSYDFRGVGVVVTQDMGALLRQPSEKAQAWRDFMFAKKILNQCTQRVGSDDTTNT